MFCGPGNAAFIIRRTDVPPAIKLLNSWGRVSASAEILDKVVEGTSVYDLGGYQLQWDEIMRRGLSFLASLKQVRAWIFAQVD